MNIKEYVMAEKNNLITWRRHFHQYPEPSQHEFKTMDFIENLLHEWQIPTVRVPKGGIIGTIDSGKPGYTVLMRADMDALPIPESPRNLCREKICVSKNPGYSHACGHDGHMSMLLTEAKILSSHRDEWDGKVVVVFEEAEEFGERGVGHIIQYLADHQIHIDACYGTHVRWDVPAGKMAILDGNVMAGTFFFRSKITGRGGHGSRPDLSVSPVDTFLAFANELQAFRMRAVDPTHCMTYSFGAVQAGQEPNVIPDTLTFAGTSRFFTNADGLAFHRTFHRLLDSACANFECQGAMIEDQMLPVVENDPTCAALARQGIGQYVGDQTVIPVEPWMASETYSLYVALYPGILAFTGIQDAAVGSGANHHTPAFDLAEDGLVTGAMSALAYVVTILREKPDLTAFKPADRDTLLRLLADGSHV